MKGRGTRTWLVLFVAVMLTAGVLGPMVARGTRSEARMNEIQLSALPSLAVNYATGAPGSTFVFSGQNLTPGSSAIIAVNGADLAPTVSVDGTGAVAFTLDTANLVPGAYFVTVQSYPNASIHFDLDPAAPLRTDLGSGPILLVPGSVGPAEQVYLPLVMRGYAMTVLLTSTPTSTSTPTPTATSTSTPTPTSTSTPTPTPTRAAGISASPTTGPGRLEYTMRLCGSSIGRSMFERNSQV